MNAVRAACALLLLTAVLAVACEHKAQLSAAQDKDSDAFDVVIVGGGLAGLTAAQELRGQRVLLLEKEDRLGGRIETKERDGLTYEMGALFEYDARWLPPEVTPSESLPGTPRIGFSQGGSVVFGSSVPDVAAQVLRRDGNAPPSAMEAPDPSALALSAPDPLRRAFFGVIHPGEMAEYIPARQLDWAATHRTRRRKAGNGELISALSRASRARIELGAPASHVREVTQGVEVIYTKDGQTKTVRAQAAVVATNAPVAAKLLGELAPDSPVRRVRYAPGIVVALGISSQAMVPFGYIGPADGGISAVFSHQQGDRRVLTIYYAREEAAAVAGLDDEALVARTIQHVSALGAGSIATKDVWFSDVERWPALGPVIAEDPYAKWSDDVTRPSERIFLAGDYTQFGEAQMPFGMAAAASSGRSAGKRVLSYLKGTLAPPARNQAAAPEAKRDALPSAGENALVYQALGLPMASLSGAAPLTRCDVFQIGGEAPEFVGVVAEGNVAPYGVLLLGRSSPDMVRQLLGAERNGLWEYSRGYGATAADTTMVLEGLLEAGVDRERLMRSLVHLRDGYYDPSSGGFSTVKSGRASYWMGPSPDTTAQVASLMQRIAPDRFQTELAGARRYLLSSQSPNGEWKSRWFPSRVLSASYAVRFLAAVPASAETTQAISRATRFMASLQRSDGSIAGSTIDTALSALAFVAAGTHRAEQDKAGAWLRERVSRGVPAGEGFLHYWFEKPKGGRAFFACKDQGGLSEALALHALKTIGSVQTAHAEKPGTTR